MQNKGGMDVLQAAVIGLGKIGLMFDVPPKGKPLSHVSAYHLNPEIELVAAVGTRPEQEKPLSLTAPEAAFYTDVEAMLRAHRPDIISICTPTSVRYELIETVLKKSGARIIFLEKPVAGTLEEAERIAGLAAGHKHQFVVNLSRRWSDGAAEVRDAVRQLRYGRLRKAHIRYTRGIYNYGSHMFDLLRFIAGSIDTVRVLERIPTNMDEHGDLSYTFTFAAAAAEEAGGGGFTGYAEAFDDREYTMFELDLFFEHGKIEILQGGDEIRYFGTEVHPLMNGIRRLVLEQTNYGMLNRSSTIQNAVSHLADVLLRGAKPICTLEDGLYPSYVAEALKDSCRSGGNAQKVRIGGRLS
ncbi:hypothetical protein SD70_14010 [Gordoniibacillus kamchatkensis]|uniref:Gfo/Idh/MocA-like oxidoreductase N-terminal domain-containing protein n=1 Tax=Gordoniibacillus kamchatkensis TaxID=1590651 RepID=A0ABR5AHW7_9BACL|nr:Gfo/Idh/MocA family oxidoreductase [Paenibacillus sp. VKM B-2647]KIL40353.1 hypothetical protein SD70_14010 [Paenibacillus sp. VKM B-2647]